MEKEKIIQITPSVSGNKFDIKTELWGLSNKGRLFFLSHSVWIPRAGAESINHKCSKCGKEIEK